MAAELFYLPFPTAFSSNGLPEGGAKLYFYTTGTLTPAAIYTTSALTVEHSNPVVANGAGRFSSIYLDSSVTYRLIIKDADGTTLDDVDPYVPGVSSATITVATGTSVSTRAALAAVASPVDLQAAFLTEEGREGMFVFDTANLSASVTVDTQQGIYVAPSSDTTGTSGAWVRKFTHLTPEMFGMVGDGSTDNTAAMKAMVSTVNLLGTAHILFGPNKTYYIAGYITAANGNTENDMKFDGVDGLTIDLNGSKIDVNGTFDRALTTTYGYDGLFVSQSSNVTIKNGELDGNFDATTMTGSLAEPPVYGIRLGECVDVRLENLYVHHFNTDGLLFRDAGADPTRKACRRVQCVNVRSHYNGRQGCSITALREASFINCDFSWTGRKTENAYTGHSPQAGVDIEPDRDTTGVGADQMDVDTGQLLFLNCTFAENAGAQFVCGGSKLYDTIKLDSCTITVGGGSTAGVDALIIGCPGFVMENCDLDLGAANATGRFYIWPNPVNVAGEIRVLNNRFSGGGSLLYTSGTPTGPVIIEGNTLTANGTAAYAGGGVLVLNDGTDIRFQKNRVFIPKEMYTDGGAGDYHAIFNFAAVVLSEDNEFETDLLAASGDGGTAHFANQYGATTLVRNDKYTGTAVGTADTFRSAITVGRDTTTPFSQNNPIGYNKGDSVAQATSKATGVTLNELCGRITMDAAALAADTTVSFTLTNSKLALGDVVVINHASTGTLGAYAVNAAAAAGSATISVRNLTAGSLSEAIQLRFAVIKASSG